MRSRQSCNLGFSLKLKLHFSTINDSPSIYLEGLPFFQLNSCYIYDLGNLEGLCTYYIQSTKQMCKLGQTGSICFSGMRKEIYSLPFPSLYIRQRTEIQVFLYQIQLFPYMLKPGSFYSIPTTTNFPDQLSKLLEVWTLD